MGQQFRVLLVDDGELDDVRDALLGLGVEFAHLRGGAVPARLEPPRDLFVASGRRAALARPWPGPGPDGRPTRIAVVGEDSGTLRSALRAMGFSYLVRRPVHPVVLRLLLQHAIYRGEERRHKPRVPLGYDVVVKSGLRRRNALLVDVSEDGCRLLLHDPLPEGAKISLQVPNALCGDEGVSLSGRVLRCGADRSSPADGGHAAAIRFGQLGERARALLERALAAHRIGGTAGSSAAGSHAPAAPLDSDEPASRLVRRIAPASSAGRETASPSRRAGAAPGAGPEGRRQRAARTRERRRGRRGRYVRRVVAAAAEGAVHRVLIGRDLSERGMRVDPHPDLVVGASLRLALYDPAREAPIVVEASVVRDDGERGVAIVFSRLGEQTSRRLEQLVATLPPVECLLDGETGALGTVVSEIL